VAARLHGGARARATIRTALQLLGRQASPWQLSTRGAVQALLPPCPEESSQGRVLLSETVSQPPLLPPHCGP